MHSLDRLLIGAGSLLLISVITSKGANRFGIPALLMFLGIGMLAGEQGPGGILFSDYHLSRTLGIIALVFILFAGGLDTHIKSIRPVYKSGLALSTLGVVITTALVGVFSAQCLGFSILEGLLLGAAVSSTDVAAVFTVLRARNVSFKNDRIRALLELESGLNDPMTVFLSVGFLELIKNPDASWVKLIPVFFLQMAIGMMVGWAAGKIIAILINRLQLEFEGLHPVLTVALVIITYGFTEIIGGSGFLAVYVAGIVLGNQNFLQRSSLIHFHDALAWIMQIAMFLTMGLLVFPHDLSKVMVPGIMVSIFAVVIARPVGVWLCLLPTKFSFAEKMMVAWAGLRGAVPIILATYPLLAHVPKSHTIFNVVFFVVFTSVLLQGTTIPMVAKWLGVAAPLKKKVRFPIEYNPTGNLKNELVELTVQSTSKVIDRALIDLNLPANALVVLIQREGDILVPRGGTKIQSEDTLLVLAPHDQLITVQGILGA